VYAFAHGTANPQTVDRQEQAKLPQSQGDTTRKKAEVRGKDASLERPSSLT
jgi:hypothetical protein